jgi:hypothetical protein
MKLRNLEDFRLNEYLMPKLVLLNSSPADGIEMSYTMYALHAFHNTYQDIQDLEQQSTFVNNGKRSSISIALWFLALESLINCLCKIACQKENKDFSRDLGGKSISTRLDFVFNTYNVDGLALKQTGLVTRINEFLQFRNEIFHDRNFGEQLKFSKTNFSTLPFYNNQVDVFQSLLIFLEIACALRYIIKELDLMPNISIANQDVLIFEKLDTLYLILLRPYFEKVLAKHNLTTQLNLDISKFYSQKPNENDYFKRGEVVPVFRLMQENKFKHNLSQEDTNIGVELYNQVVESYQKPKGHHDSMNFMINWPKLYEDNKAGKL